MSDTTEFTALARQGQSHYLAGVNTELKCFIMNTLPLEEEMTTDELFREVMIDAHGGDRIEQHPYLLGEMVSKLPTGLVIVEEVREGRGRTLETRMTKQKDGHDAAALGGMILPITLGINMPLKTLVGEHNDRKSDEEHDTSISPSIDTRLFLYACLYQLPRDENEWIAVRDLNSAALSVGITKNSIASHLRTLVKSGLIDRRPVTSNGRTVELEYRIGDSKHVEGQEDIHPMPIIESYLEAIQTFTERDFEAMDAGSEFVHDTMLDVDRMPYYVCRSMAQRSLASKQSYTDRNLAKINGTQTT